MKLSSALCFVAAAVIGLHANAQTPDPTAPRPTPPDGPFLSVAPEFSAWTIVRQTIPGVGALSAEDVARNAAAVSKPEVSTSIVKTGKVRRRTTKYKSGDQEEAWYEHSNRVLMQKTWHVPMFEISVSAPDHPEGLDFPELGLVVEENFAGTQEQGGVTYLVFEVQAPDPEQRGMKEPGKKPPTRLNRVYINAETRLPWLRQTGDTLERYFFQTAPTTPLEVPPAYQALFDSYERKKIDSGRKPVPP